MSENKLQIETELVNSTSVITPVGDVDLSQSTQLRCVIKTSLDSDSEYILIDLSNVKYMDSSGVATLIEGLQLARTIGKELMLCSLTHSVEAVLQLSKLDQIFDIYPNRELALES